MQRGELEGGCGQLKSLQRSLLTAIHRVDLTGETEGRSSCKCYPQGTNQASGQSQSRQSSFFIRARLTCICVVTQTNLLRRGAWARTGVGTLSCCPKDKMHLQAVRNPGIASPPRMYSGLVEGRQPFKAIKTTQPTELRGAEARPFASAPPVHTVLMPGC